MPSANIFGDTIELKNPHSTSVYTATRPPELIERITDSTFIKANMLSSIPGINLCEHP